MIASAIILCLPIFSHYIASAGAFWSCFVLLLVFGGFNGILQGTVFGLAGIMPFKYMGAVMLGNGISGVTMNALRAILQVILPGKDNLFMVALLFFILAAMILWLCAAMYNMLNTSEYFLYYQRKSMGDKAPKP